MKWHQERWIRLYRKDSVDWMGLSRDSRGTFLQLLKWVDDEGYATAKRGLYQAVASMLYSTVDDDLKAEVDELIEDGCLVYIEAERRIFVPNFAEAQTARSAEAERKARWRDGSRQSDFEQDKSGTVPDAHETGNAKPGRVRASPGRSDQREQIRTEQREVSREPQRLPEKQNRTEQRRTDQNRSDARAGACESSGDTAAAPAPTPEDPAPAPPPVRLVGFGKRPEPFRPGPGMGKLAKAQGADPNVIRACFDLERFVEAATRDNGAWLDDKTRLEGSAAIQLLSAGRMLSIEDQRNLRVLLAVGLTDDPKGAAQ